MDVKSSFCAKSRKIGKAPHISQRIMLKVGRYTPSQSERAKRRRRSPINLTNNLISYARVIELNFNNKMKNLYRYSLQFKERNIFHTTQNMFFIFFWRFCFLLSVCIVLCALLPVLNASLFKRFGIGLFYQGKVARKHYMRSR